jgi:VWFA-related protein
VCSRLSAQILSVALFAVAAAQGQPAKPQFGVATDAVAVDVLVSDRKGPVRGLTADDFAVFDNGIAQRVQVVTADQIPLLVSLVLDTSESVSGSKLVALAHAALTLLQRLSPEDRVNLLTISDVIGLKAPVGATPVDAIAALQHLDAAGGTRLFDAVWAALALARSSPSEHRRAMVVVFSDGRDTTSWLRGEDAHTIVESSEAVIFAVSLPQPARTPGVAHNWASTSQVPNHNFLGTLADASGGRLLIVRRPEDLASAFEEGLLEMRNRYVLYYQPTGVERAGLHTLKVSLVKKTGAKVRARPGYYRPRTPASSSVR